MAGSIAINEFVSPCESRVFNNCWRLERKFSWTCSGAQPPMSTRFPGTVLLQCTSPQMAHRDSALRRTGSVAIGGIDGVIGRQLVDS